MTVPLFTLTGNILSLTGGSQIPSAGMPLVLKSNVRAGDLLSINGMAEFVGTVNVLLDSSGKINGDNGIKLLADDPVLDLSTPVQWTISSVGAGFPEFNPFTFDAPDAGETIDLLDVLPVPGLTAIGQTEPVTVNNNDGTVSVGGSLVLEPVSATTIYSNNTSPPIGKTSYYNASGGNRNPILPALSGLRVGARLAIRRDPADASANTVTLTCAGADTFYSSGSTTAALPLSGEQREYQVISISGTKYWAPAGALNPVSALDKRYLHTWPFPMARNTIACVGDSMMNANAQGQAGTLVGAGGNTSPPGAFQPFLNPTVYNLLPVLTHQRIRHTEGMYAVSNSWVYEQHDVQLPYVLAMDPLPGACILGCGAAEIVDNTSYSFSTNQGYVKSMVAQLLAAGVVPILWTIPPIRATGFAVNVATVNVELNQWNVWIRRYAALNGFPLIDAHTALAQVDGTHIPGTTNDLLHPNGPGGILISEQFLADGGAQHFPANSLVNTARTTDDLTTLFNDGTINLGLFTGDSNSDGIADHLTLAGTATCSLVVPDVTANIKGNLQRMVVAAGNSASLQAALTSGWSVGDRIALSFRLQTEGMADSGAVYLVGLKSDVPGGWTFQNGTTVTALYSGLGNWGGNGFTAPDITDGEPYVEYVIPTGATDLSVLIWILSVASGTATLDIGEFTPRNLTTGGFVV